MWPRLELECFCFFLFRTTFFNGRTRVRECCIDGNCSFSSSTGETGKGTLDLAGGVRFFDEFLLASLDASMSATYFATLLPSPWQESQGVCFRQFILKICRKFLRLPAWPATHFLMTLQSFASWTKLDFLSFVQALSFWHRYTLKFEPLRCLLVFNFVIARSTPVTSTPSVT